MTAEFEKKLSRQITVDLFLKITDKELSRAKRTRIQGMTDVEDLAEDEIAILNNSEVDKKLSNFLRRQFGWELTEDVE